MEKYIKMQKESALNIAKIVYLMTVMMHLQPLSSASNFSSSSSALRLSDSPFEEHSSSDDDNDIYYSCDEEEPLKPVMR
jgi:hypothetical protein